MDEFERYRREFDAQPLQRLLGITLVERRAGFGRIRLTRTADTPQGIGGSVHGGVLAAMVDVAMLVAVFSQIRPDQQPAGTADLNITYLRPANTPRVFADANVIRHGRQLATITVDITDDTDRLCATGRTLYAFRPIDAATPTD